MSTFCGKTTRWNYLFRSARCGVLFFLPWISEYILKSAMFNSNRALSVESSEINMAITVSADILDLCLRKTRADKSRDYRDVIVFEKFRFQDVIRPHQNAERFRKASFSLDNFSDLVLTERPNCRNKAPFSNFSRFCERDLRLFKRKLSVN